jgi:hypothetical protein
LFELEPVVAAVAGAVTAAAPDRTLCEAAHENALKASFAFKRAETVVHPELN